MGIKSPPKNSVEPNRSLMSQCCHISAIRLLVCDKPTTNDALRQAYDQWRTAASLRPMAHCGKPTTNTHCGKPTTNGALRQAYTNDIIHWQSNDHRIIGKPVTNTSMTDLQTSPVTVVTDGGLTTDQMATNDATNSDRRPLRWHSLLVHEHYSLKCTVLQFFGCNPRVSLFEVSTSVAATGTTDSMTGTTDSVTGTTGSMTGTTDSVTTVIVTGTTDSVTSDPSSKPSSLTYSPDRIQLYSKYVY